MIWGRGERGDLNKNDTEVNNREVAALCMFVYYSSKMYISRRDNNNISWKLYYLRHYLYVPINWVAMLSNNVWNKFTLVVWCCFY